MDLGNSSNWVEVRGLGKTKNHRGRSLASQGSQPAFELGKENTVMRKTRRGSKEKRKGKRERGRGRGGGGERGKGGRGKRATVGKAR